MQGSRRRLTPERRRSRNSLQHVAAQLLRELGAGRRLTRDEQNGVLAGDRARDARMPGEVDRLRERIRVPFGVRTTTIWPLGSMLSAQRANAVTRASTRSASAASGGA
jgi:hypothetical protein